ncbi:TetR/AcrR family transcriptional regulator [Jatrophihabitans fulvus]
MSGSVEQAEREAPSAPDAGACKPGKRMRADAARNRDLLLATAAEAFEERGAEAPLEDIAKRAGVGIGTLYRHFPTREVLLEAVYRREVETLCDQVEELRSTREPVEALADWMRAFVVYVARKRGMAMALKAALGPDTPLFAESRDRIRGSLRLLVGDAVEAGEIRPDVDPMDLMQAMSGICMAADASGGTGHTTRIVELLLDGLRFGAPKHVSTVAQ